MTQPLPASHSANLRSVNTTLNMQENDSSVKGPAPSPKPTKYRLACDSCQHSKIRCDQERPKCRRCAKKGIDCVYSPARRAGRPRTRNHSKSTSSVENNASASLKGYAPPMTEHSITIPASGWMSPFAPPNILSASDNCPNSGSSSSSASNTSTISGMAQNIQIPNPDDMEFTPYHQSDDDFLQSLPDLTASQCGTPKQTANCYYPMSPDFHIAPELLNMNFCGALWEQQQHQEYGQQEQTSTTMHLDKELPYFGLLTPDEHSSHHHPDQHQEDPSIRTTSSDNIETCSFVINPKQQINRQSLQPLDDTHALKKSCNCVSILLDHLSTSSHPPSSSSLASTSVALSISRRLITCCCSTMVCPNACSSRPSTALVICEAIDRALLSLKLGGTSLWTPAQPASAPNYENGTCSSPSSSPSSSSTSSGNSTDIMLPSSVVNEEHEPLCCGTLPIRGADRRAVVRVLLVKRVLEVQGVLERLRDTLMSGLLVGGDMTAKKPLLTLCADVAGEFARKVTERLDIVKLQM